MGTMQHRVVAATGGDWCADAMLAAAEEVRDLLREKQLADEYQADYPSLVQGPVVGPHEALVNGYVTWLFVEDGSKEWWAMQEAADECRRQFVARMDAAGAMVYGAASGDLGSQVLVGAEWREVR